MEIKKKVFKSQGRSKRRPPIRLFLDYDVFLVFRVRSEHRCMNQKTECLKMHLLFEVFQENQIFIFFCPGYGRFLRSKLFRTNFSDQEKKNDHFPTFHEKKKFFKNRFLSMIPAPKCTKNQFIWPSHSKDTCQTLYRFTLFSIGNENSFYSKNTFF